MVRLRRTWYISVRQVRPGGGTGGAPSGANGAFRAAVQVSLLHASWLAFRRMTRVSRKTGW